MNLDDLRRDIKIAGIRGACFDIAYRVANKVTTYMVLQAMRLTPETMDPAFLKGNERHVHGFLDEATLRRYAKDPAHEMTDAFVGEALSKGDRCYAIRDGDVLANYGWYSNRETRVTDALLLRFSPEWIYMYKGFTRPDYRGQRLHGTSMAMALTEYAKEGFRGIVSYVEAHNFASLKSVHRMGYVDVGRMRVVRLFGRHRIRVEEACRPYGFDLVAAPRTS